MPFTYLGDMVYSKVEFDVITPITLSLNLNLVLDLTKTED